MEFTVKDNTSIFLSEFARKKKMALEAIGATAEGYAVEDCPVDTGRLRNSITYAVKNGQGVPNTHGGEHADANEYRKHSEPSADDVYIGTNVTYAMYVEFLDKYRHTSGKAHFLRDAATTHTQEYREIVKAALRS